MKCTVYKRLIKPPQDFEIEDHLDADPESANAIKSLLGISENYHAAIPFDPPDDQFKLYSDALMGLTPRGRGEDISHDDVDDGTEDSFF